MPIAAAYRRHYEPVAVSEGAGLQVDHRRGTLLNERHRCRRGHVSAGYKTGNNWSCAVCAKIRSYRRRGLPLPAEVLKAERTDPQPKPNRLERSLDCFTRYADARARHEEIGGYLLRLAGGGYGVTDDYRKVSVLRGRDWVDECERLECWDEVERGRRNRKGTH